ncbi:MAG: extracellular solute-binding protein [Hungatella sp.]|nr:extracellular solute-binding protein [Hungatella sp.]
MKKTLAVILAAAMTMGSLAGCGGSGDSQTTTTAAQGGQESSGASQESGEQKETAKATGEKQKIEFWYHAADEQSTAMFEKIFEELNASQSNYEFVYTGFANKDFPDAFATAIATGTMPDVVSLGFSNVMTYVAMDALHPMQAEFEGWSDSGKIVPSLVSTLKNLAGGEDLYGVPYGYNQDLSWYNAAAFTEKGIEVPQTQKEFLTLCEQYADSANGNYFFSLRGNKPYDNLLGWLFTYTDGLGYEGSYFDESGKCILNAPEFAEAMDAYVNIYKNGWVSGDCVNNGFNEMVAEFGAGTALYIMHNSSSEKNHLSNLGEGNYGITKALTNDKGRYLTSSMQPNIFSICNKGEGADYSGAMELIASLCSADTMNTMCETMAKVPTNTDCYETDWFKNDTTMETCMEIVEDKNFVQIQNPYWLTSYFTFINGDMTTDFQAVLLGEMTSQECLDKWAEFLTQEQAAYLAQQ